MERHFGRSQTMLLCRRLRRWHGASFSSSVGGLVLLGLLEFSDWQTRSGTGGGMSPCKPLIVILNWFPCVIRCSVQWAPSIASFSCFGIYSCVSRRCRSLLWLHSLLIELQVDGVSRECEGFITVVFTETFVVWGQAVRLHDPMWY